MDHQDAVDLVKTVFKQMGGIVLPPRRPGRTPPDTILTVARDNFMMDFENSCLSQNWDNAKKQHPTGILRHSDAEWAAMIKKQVYPNHSDVDWEEYCEWVCNGGGDEWFQEEDEDEDEEEKEEGPEKPSERCSGCGRGDDFCRCGMENTIWFGGYF
jgi:hypothetical protein